MDYKKFNSTDLEHQLAGLPLQAVGAFAVRCARRSDDDFFKTLSNSLRFAEQYVDGLMSAAKAVVRIERDAQSWLDYEGDVTDQDYSVAYGLTAVSMVCTIELSDSEPTPGELQRLLYFAAMAAYQSATRSSNANSGDTILSPRAVRAVHGDLAFVRSLFGSDNRTQDSTVAQHAFGDLWPADEISPEERATHPLFEGNIDHLREVLDLTNATGNEREFHKNKVEAISQLELFGANLKGADLRNVKFRGADLDRCDLSSANLSGSDLTESSIRKADLRGADLSRTRLKHSDLCWTNLSRTTLGGAELQDANLVGARMEGTQLGDLDLSQTTGLKSIVHLGPSSLGTDTLYRSQGKIPEVFLRGCGLSDWEIQAAKLYSPALGAGEIVAVLYEVGRLKGERSIEFYSCFISYSTKDQEFADRLHADLQDRGVRCWFAPHDIRAGRKVYEQIDEAIHLYDRLLLILSEHSMDSGWVRTEIAHARQKELTENRQTLFPISLVAFSKIREWKCFDADMGKDSAREIREYFIPDFGNWKDHDSYQAAFQRLVRDLKAEAKRPGQ